MTGASDREGAATGEAAGGPSMCRVAASTAAAAVDAVAEIAATLSDAADIGFLLVFASPHYDADELVGALSARFPDVPRAGCSTAGEIAHDGITRNSVLAIALPRARFEVVATPLEGLSRFGIEAGAEHVAALRRRLVAERGDDCGDVFAVTLLDGLCRREERIVSALHRALDDIPLVGGSSGDDLAFRDTFVFFDGRVLRDAGVLLLVRTDLPFRVFKTDHLEPTPIRMVVTACDTEARVVHELDAEPARTAFAAATGLDRDDPGRIDFAAHPLVVRVGGDYYCRSIQKMNDDGSFSFYCAIDTGVVLTLARTRDMTASLDLALGELDAELGGLDFVIGFDCVHRRLEAIHRQVLGSISQVLRRWRVFGFNTYGEQFGAMHLNNTFTGIAVGRPRSAP